MSSNFNCRFTTMSSLTYLLAFAVNIFFHLSFTKYASFADLITHVHVYKCTNHGSKTINRHTDYTHGCFYKLYSSETIFTAFNSKHISKILLDRLGY